MWICFSKTCRRLQRACLGDTSPRCQLLAPRETGTPAQSLLVVPSQAGLFYVALVHPSHQVRGCCPRAHLVCDTARVRHSAGQRSRCLAAVVHVFCPVSVVLPTATLKLGKRHKRQRKESDVKSSSSNNGRKEKENKK